MNKSTSSLSKSQISFLNNKSSIDYSQIESDIIILRSILNKVEKKIKKNISKIDRVGISIDNLNKNKNNCKKLLNFYRESTDSVLYGTNTSYSFFE